MPSLRQACGPLTDSTYRYDTLFRQAATRQPGHPAMIYRDLTLTYGEALSMVDRLAHGLHALGLRQGDCLCLYMSNRPEFSITFLAAASLGLVVTPISATCKDHELHYQLADAEAQGIVLEQTVLPALQRVLSHHPPSKLRQVIVLDRAQETGNILPAIMPFSNLLDHSPSQELPVVHVQPDDLLALPYSSGTTGLPKGVMLSHRNLAINHRQFIQSLGLTSSEVALLFLPFSHIYGFMLTGSFLGCGGTQVIMEHFDLPLSLSLCEQHRVTHFFAIPPIVRTLSQVKKSLSQLDSVRCIFCGAAPLPLQSALQLQKKIKAAVVQAYGLTEAAPLTHAQPRSPHLRRLASIGKPVDQTEQKIVDAETGTRELPVGACGEIIIRGPQVMQGYWKTPNETALALRRGWLHTGDIGYIDEQGYTYIVDRKKDMIKHKGFSIAPAELEAILLQHPSVSETAVIGLEDDSVGELIKGFVVLHQGEHVETDALLEFANSQLAHHKHFHCVEIVPALPHTPSGKIPRRQLRKLDRAHHATIATRLTDTTF